MARRSSMERCRSASAATLALRRAVICASSPLLNAATYSRISFLWGKSSGTGLPPPVCENVLQLSQVRPSNVTTRIRNRMRTPRLKIYRSIGIDQRYEEFMKAPDRGLPQSAVQEFNDI